jgi:tRNA/rRNA methyltransferase
VRSPIVAAQTLKAKYDAGEKVGVLYGREKSGLSNEEVALADEIVTFPVNPAFASLNIAQAVLLMSYEWMKTSMESDSQTPFDALEQKPATKEQLFGLFDHIEEALDARGFFRPAAKKPKMIDNLRAVLSRRAFTAPEIKVMRGVVSSLDRFSRKHPRGTGNPDETDHDD